MEGRFWLCLILTFALAVVFAFFTENEQIFWKELEFTVESTGKGMDFLGKQINQKFPLFNATDLKRIFALVTRESFIVDEKEDFAATFDLLLAEKDKIDRIIQDQHWKIRELKPLLNLSEANLEPSPMLPGVSEYANLMVSSSLSTATSAKLQQILEKCERWKLQDLERYKQIILAWFDKQLSLQENIIQRHASLAVGRINSLKDALKQRKVTDERLKSAIKRKINNLEDILLNLHEKFNVIFVKFTDKLKMSTGKEKTSKEKPKIDNRKANEPAPADETNFDHFENFKEIFEKIQILEFQ